MVQNIEVTLSQQQCTITKIIIVEKEKRSFPYFCVFPDLIYIKCIEGFCKIF